MTLLALVLLAGQGEVVPHRQDRPPNRPYAAEEAIARMTVPDGFRVELVAAEPDLANPVAMAFDDRGRIWVAESIEYPRKEPGPGRDRIQVLEDTDLDGRADRFTVFAEGLNIPTGVAAGHGGVWVLNAPDLLLFKEKHGRAESREVVLTGFGRADTHELPNSLTWGPDGWLYGLNGVFNPSRIASRGRVFTFTCALFRVHPRTREFQVVCEGTSNPWGVAWDLEGSALVSACHWATDHIFHFVETGYYQRQAGAYPPHTLRIGSISTHGHQKTAYCGLAYLDSDAYPPEYRERLYFGNIHGNCINSDSLRRDGSTYLSQAEPDLLAANDAWFMPVAQKVGPDGCLYILDWYDRYHCYQDANRDPAGIDRLKGRLYRLRHLDSPRAERFDLQAESADRLLGRLGSPNIFFREAAQRILTERASAGETAGAIRRKLEAQAIAGDEVHRKARLHALWSLIGTGSLEPGFHERLLEHPDPAFRAWAVRAAGNFGSAGGAIRDRVAALARDPAPEVELQVAVAARKLEGLDPLAVLVQVLSSCGEDKLIPSIVWPNLHPLLETESARFARLVEAAGERLPPALVRLLPRSIERTLSARRPDLDSVRAILELLRGRDVERAREALSAVARKLGDLPESECGRLREGLAPLLGKLLEPGEPLGRSARLLGARLGLGPADPRPVREEFLAAGAGEAERVEALEALVAFRDPALLEALKSVLDSGSSGFLARVLPVLGRLDDPRLAGLVLERYPRLDPELQPLAIDLLLEREPWARQVLDAVLAKKLPAAALNANHLRKILDTNDREAVWAVERAWGAVREERNPEQERVVAAMASFLREQPGDPHAGERVFRKLCAQCHAIYGQGKNVGPDLTSSGRASFDQLLSSVFDPSLVIGPGYQTTLVVTRDGRNLTGIVVEDGAERIVLKLPGEAVEAVPRSRVKYTRASKLSMMPEGIETALDRGEIRDLFAFLALDRHPGDSRARPIPGAPKFARR